jgi:iron complex outermembrane receptor protein
MKKITLFLFLLQMTVLSAQKDISGVVTDNTGAALAGVNVVEKGAKNATITDAQGIYKIRVADGAKLVFSYVGFSTVERSTDEATAIDVVMSAGQELSEVQVVGSRNSRRTVVNSAVPIDIIDVKSVTTQSGKIEINELLQYAAPSFNANKQSGSDGADHIDPATLRGMGPDQTLVLINGKRRHQSSLVNLFGTRGRGNTGTDLNAIPASAIKRIEILRDGAAAQYGSDAIAGVINIVLNDNTDSLTGSVSYGAYSTNADGNFPPGTANTGDNFLDTNADGNKTTKKKSFDGNSLKVTTNYGTAIGEKGGYANFTAEYINKDKTLRPGFDFRRGFGEASIEGFNFMANLALPVTDKTEIYAFGGRNYRDTDAYAFTRTNPTPRNVISIYPNGFTPRITSNIVDNAVTAGLRTETDSGWKIDISNTFGKNVFHYFIEGTLNASLEEASPTEFDAGGHTLSQNTINLDLSKNYPSIMSGLNFAFGGEYRTENFTIFAGEEGSYATYDINGVPVTDPTTQTIPTDDETGEPRPGGSQGFPGYSPENVVDRSRSNVSLYADAELDVSDKFLIGGAARFENYSDFGSTLNGKLSMRFTVANGINLRGSVGSGFRAPSLAQIYYNLRFTNFSSTGASEILLSPNNSPVTKAFGIDKLNEEKALNASIGFTASFGDFTATIDGYFIRVTDRIVLTGYFDATALDIGVDQAQFFVNGVDTSTSGLDVVLSWRKKFGDNGLSATLVGNINNMDVDDVHNGPLDQQTFFGEREKSFLLASAPDNKFSLNLAYDRKWFDAGLAFTRFSEVDLLDYQMYEDVADYGSFANQIAAATDHYGVKIVTDLTLGFKLNSKLKLSVGANNLLNVYPDQQDDWVEAGGYWDAVQMGFGGAFYYARLGFRL